MNINTTKVISLLFFIFSAFYLYTAYQIQVFAFDENAPFNARTFPIYLGYAGLFFSGLKLILPDPNTIKVQHKTLEYKKTLRPIFSLLKNNMMRTKIMMLLKNNQLLRLWHHKLLQ